MQSGCTRLLPLKPPSAPGGAPHHPPRKGGIGGRCLDAFACDLGQRISHPHAAPARAALAVDPIVESRIVRPPDLAGSGRDTAVASTRIEVHSPTPVIPCDSASSFNPMIVFVSASSCSSHSMLSFSRVRGYVASPRNTTRDPMVARDDDACCLHSNESAYVDSLRHFFEDPVTEDRILV